jgi:hypothetical protein
VQVREARDFLVQQTAEQALLEGIPLSDLEKRMMYFTESEEVSENPIKPNDAFEAEYDSDEYETKISLLLHHAYSRIEKENPQALTQWKDAIRTLSKGDHYISVLWAYEPNNVEERPRFDQPKLFGAGLAIACAALFIAFNSHRIAPYLPEFFRSPIGWRVLVYGLVFSAAGLGYFLKARKI